MRAATLLLLAAAVACTRRNIVECEGAATCVAFPGGECRVNSATGNQWCVYPDPTCPSGIRWSEANTGDGLEGACVEGSVDASGSCQQIAFLSPRDGDTDIWVTNFDGSGQRALTVNDDAEHDLSWSPSGDRIAYARLGMIWVMNADGTDQHPITTGTDEKPTWSPDGSQILFVRSATGNSLWTVAAAGGTPIPLTADAPGTIDHAWSPDGSRIAFSTMRDGDYEVYVMLADGSGETNLTNSPGASDHGPIHWSPDGASITFLSNRSGIEDLWSMSSTGASPLGLNSNTGQAQVQGYDLSPDGAQIVFALIGVGEVGLLEMNVDGTGLHQLIPVQLTAELFPEISPDGTLITWVHFLNDGEIGVANRDGTNPTRLTNSPGNDLQPTFRPCP